jgi:hypothetical protein
VADFNPLELEALQLGPRCSAVDACIENEEVSQATTGAECGTWVGKVK